MNQRIIKFRAWRSYDKRMGHFEPGFSWHDEYDLWYLAQVQQEHDKPITDVPCEDNIVLMQFTGLKDKNGKEIYEGDIVRVYGENRLVEFKNAFWQLELYEETNVLGGFGTPTEAGHKPLYRYSEKWIEVIGNIYENADLLTPHP